VVPVHLLSELDEVPAVRDRGTAEPGQIAREVDRGRNNGERDEKDDRVEPAPRQEVEWPPCPGPTALVRSGRDGDRRDEQADERVRARPLRGEREPEQHTGDQDVEERGAPGFVRGDDEVPAGDDEGRDVDVVHADTRLCEHRAVEDDRETDERGQHGRRKQAACEEHEQEGEERRQHDAR